MSSQAPTVVDHRVARLAICETGDVLSVETCIRRRAGIAARTRLAAFVRSQQREAAVLALARRRFDEPAAAWARSLSRG